MTARYSFGGDEHVFVEVSEEMSLEAFFTSLSLCRAVKESGIRGVTEICPANASLQVKFDPDVIHPDDLLAEMKALEAAAATVEPTIATRIVEMPVFYDDPWTRETLMRFRERHQDPTGTDLEYTARINGYPDVPALVAAHAGSPWFVSMVGFVAGLPFLYQMVERARQIQAPKYLRPRTDTPKLTVGHGGCFGAIYSVRGAGGYQMFGITPMPIYDPRQEVGYLEELMTFFRPGDIVKFRSVTRDAYDEALREVEANRFAPVIRPMTFDLHAFNRDPAAYNLEIEGFSMTIEVIRPGLATAVQDLGRPGFYDVGIPLSGAMDRFALRVGNMLVGNDEGAAALECVFMGPELRFTADATVAVTGADLPPKLDGEACPRWEAFAVKAGQVVSFDYLRGGARAYVAVAGGIDVPVVLGSRSTYALGALGGLEGRVLKAGDVLPLGGPPRATPLGVAVPEGLRRGAAPPETLRMMPGLYHHRIMPDSLAGFFADTWAVAPEADRIGYRFRGGTPLAFVDREPPFGAGSDPSNIVDSCYPYGSIQVPGGREPIVLHRDAVSGGGYFMIGTVVSADMDFIGQLQPHTKMRSVAVTMDEALAARRERRDMLARVRDALAVSG